MKLQCMGRLGGGGARHAVPVVLTGSYAPACLRFPFYQHCTNASHVTSVHKHLFKSDDGRSVFKTV